MENKYQYRTDEFKINSKLIKKINFRPNGHISVCFLFGVVFLLLNNFLLKCIGILFILLTIASIMVIKNKLVAEIYNDYLIIYDEKDSTLMNIIFYEDLKQYYYDEPNRCYIIETIDNYCFSIKTSSGVLDEKLRTLAPDKERLVKMQKEAALYRKKKKWFF